MKPYLLLAFSAVFPVALSAHPMGNFSVNHYTRLETTDRGVHIRYVLDLAEIPSLELLQQWNADGNTPPDVLQQKAAEQARQWTKNLMFTVDGRSVAPHLSVRP